MNMHTDSIKTLHSLTCCNEKVRDSLYRLIVVIVILTNIQEDQTYEWLRVEIGWPRPIYTLAAKI